LHFDEGFEIVNLEQRLGAIHDLPHHHGPDLDRVGVVIVDLQFGGLEVSDPKRDLGLDRERIGEPNPGLLG
jgi:hypothetical protein